MWVIDGDLRFLKLECSISIKCHGVRYPLPPWPRNQPIQITQRGSSQKAHIVWSAVQNVILRFHDGWHWLNICTWLRCYGITITEETKKYTTCQEELLRLRWFYLVIHCLRCIFAVLNCANKKSLQERLLSSGGGLVVDNTASGGVQMHC